MVNGSIPILGQIFITTLTTIQIRLIKTLKEFHCVTNYFIFFIGNLSKYHLYHLSSKWTSFNFSTGLKLIYILKQACMELTLKIF